MSPTYSWRRAIASFCVDPWPSTPGKPGPRAAPTCQCRHAHSHPCTTEYPGAPGEHAHLPLTHLVEGGLGGTVHVLQGGLVTVHPRSSLQSWGLDLDF